MKRIWFFITTASLITLMISVPNLSIEALMNAGRGGVELLLKLVGIYAIWLGFLEIVEQSGLSKKIASLLSPMVDWLFGKIDKQTKEYISLNISANMLGLGNASTPLGLKAMQSLDKQNTKNEASLPMITLVVLNATSLQLIPTTIISLRQTYQSVNSTDIILPTILATVFSTVLGIVLVKLCNKMRRRKNAS